MAVDDLLSKGGFNSMMYTVSLIICAMMFGGIMEHSGQMHVLVKAILRRVDTNRSLMGARRCLPHWVATFSFATNT